MIDTLGAQLKNQLGNALKNGSAVSMVMGGASGLRNGLMENGAQLAMNVAMAHANQPPPQHRPPADRKRGLSEYSASAYPDGAPLRDEQQTWLTGLRAAPRGQSCCRPRQGSMDLLSIILQCRVTAPSPSDTD